MIVPDAVGKMMGPSSPSSYASVTMRDRTVNQSGISRVSIWKDVSARAVMRICRFLR